MTSRRILVVDDEKSLCDYLAILLRREGYTVDVTTSVEDAFERLPKVRYDLVLSDLMIGKRSGLEIVQALNTSQTPVVLMTAYGTVEKAVEALRLGACDFILKPFQNEVMLQALRKALEEPRREDSLSAESKTAAGSGSAERLLQDLVGASVSIQNLRTLISKVALSESTVLITGESGTGKEVVARSLHRLSVRSARPFLPIHCAALSEGLLESELFGHVKGSFTGATGDTVGLFVAAKGGTVLLDEVGEIPLSTQVKLLRVLQEREVTPVGGTQAIPIDVRILAATNADLETLVAKGRFREDLFYRLNVIRVRTPSLRDRVQDIPLLSQALLVKICRRLGRPAATITASAAHCLAQHRWPGNIRELENVLERSLVLCPEAVLEEADIAMGSVSDAWGEGFGEPAFGAKMPPPLEEMQKAYIYWILTRTQWHIPQASAILGIEPDRLHRMIQHYGIKEVAAFPT